MMKKIMMMAALMAATVSCSKDFTSSDNNIESEVRTISIVASIDKQTRVATPSTDGYEWNFEWEVDDKLIIPNSGEGISLTIDPNNFDKYNATFTGEVPTEGMSYLYSGYDSFYTEEYRSVVLWTQDGTLNKIPLRSSEMIDFATVTDGIQPVKMEHTVAFVKLNTTFDSDMSGYTLKSVGVMNMNSLYRYNGTGPVTEEVYEAGKITITPATPIEATNTQSVPFSIFPTTIASGGAIRILLTLEDAEGSIKYAVFTKSPADGTSYNFNRATVNNINISCSTADFVEFEGEGTDSNPFKISTAKQLNELSVLTNFMIDQDYGNYCYEQTADIDLKNIKFTPIENFRRTYNGGGHIIKGLHVESISGQQQALFGFIDYATIINLGVEGSVYTTSIYAAGIVGNAFSNCTIVNCYNRCNIEAEDYAGGIAGYLGQNNNIINCYNAGSITTGNDKGGLAGYISNSANELKNSYYIDTTSDSYGDIYDLSECTINAEKKSQSEMQNAAFVTLMNEGVDTYNAENTDGVQAIKWKAVANDYPTFDNVD